TDNFFELGGDSIQGAMFINRLQKELGQIVYVMSLFDAPTVGQFAEFLQASYPEAAVRLGGEAPATRQAERSAVEIEAAVRELRAAVARRLGREPEAMIQPYGGPRLPRTVFL